MSWYAELDRELDESIKHRNDMENLQYELDKLYVTNANNVRKAHKVFRCLRHVEEHTMRCPTCGTRRDEDGILAHKMDCYLANTLEFANDE